MKIVNLYFILTLILITSSSFAKENNRNTEINSIERKRNTEKQKLTLGIERRLVYLPLLTNKNVALVVNQTSAIGENHLVDILLSEKIAVKTIFAPEHGFRGKADAGEKVKDGVDLKTNLPIISLYGKHKKPTPEDLKGIDIVVFDIQDVGARFYTYISTLHYIMEACTENNIKVLVLDRPNPNGHFVDGNVLDLKFKSFVGMHPIPVVHGMTIAEYAKMINGEKWLTNGIQCDLTFVKCLNYDRNEIYKLPIKPSPNLPNSKSINLYPSICFFEGTQISIGRGTEFPFQVIGSPLTKKIETDFTFTPKSTSGAKYPKHENKSCFGLDLRNEKIYNSLDLTLLIQFYNSYKDKDHFFLENNFIDLLAGTDQLRKNIQAGKTAKEIKASWEPALSQFKETRKKYLLYK
tara:strand:- start:1074 stop:2294 length:1221 start_codon:yes stop_codon:yes gene_type:complete